MTHSGALRKHVVLPASAVPAVPTVPAVSTVPALPKQLVAAGLTLRADIVSRWYDNVCEVHMRTTAGESADSIKKNPLLEAIVNLGNPDIAATVYGLGPALASAQLNCVVEEGTSLLPRPSRGVSLPETITMKTLELLSKHATTVVEASSSSASPTDYCTAFTAAIPSGTATQLRDVTLDTLAPHYFMRDASIACDVLDKFDLSDGGPYSSTLTATHDADMLLRGGVETLPAASIDAMNAQIAKAFDPEQGDSTDNDEEALYEAYSALFSLTNFAIKSLSSNVLSLSHQLRGFTIADEAENTTLRKTLDAAAVDANEFLTLLTDLEVVQTPQQGISLVRNRDLKIVETNVGAMKAGVTVRLIALAKNSTEYPCERIKQLELQVADYERQNAIYATLIAEVGLLTAEYSLLQRKSKSRVRADTKKAAARASFMDSMRGIMGASERLQASKIDSLISSISASSQSAEHSALAALLRQDAEMKGVLSRCTTLQGEVKASQITADHARADLQLAEAAKQEMRVKLASCIPLFTMRGAPASTPVMHFTDTSRRGDSELIARVTRVAKVVLLGT